MYNTWYNNSIVTIIQYLSRNIWQYIKGMSAHLTAEFNDETQLYLDNSTQSHGRTTHQTNNQSEISIRIPVKLPAYPLEYLLHHQPNCLPTCYTGSRPVRLAVTLQPTYQNICYTTWLPLFIRMIFCIVIHNYSLTIWHIKWYKSDI